MNKGDGDVCEKCRFWAFRRTLELGDMDDPVGRRTVSYGECRRHAPAALHEEEERREVRNRLPDLAKWPYTESEDWCGEWKAAE